MIKTLVPLFVFVATFALVQVLYVLLVLVRGETRASPRPHERLRRKRLLSIKTPAASDSRRAGASSLEACYSGF